MDTQIAEILARLGIIEQRVTTLNHEYGAIVKCVKQNGIEVTKTCKDVEWLKKFFWVVVTTSAGSLIAILWQLLWQLLKG